MQADLLLVAALLRRGRSLDHCSSALSLVAVLLGLSPLLGAPSSLGLALLCIALLAAGLAQKYWALRVALDAELFAQLALAGEQLGSQTQALDQALQRLKLQPVGLPERSWNQRGQGALGLLRKQALCLLLQVALLMLAIVLIHLFPPLG
ncbi:hypothetical protein ACJRW5_15645 [Pseudomonas sp. SH1-B]